MYEVVDMRDIGLRGAKDVEIANYAQSRKLCILSGDLGFCNIRNYSPREYNELIQILSLRPAAPDNYGSPADLYLTAASHGQ